MANPYTPRVVVGKVRAIGLNLAERLAIRPLAEQLGDGLPRNDALRRLRAACLFCRKARELAPHAPKRAAVRQELRDVAAAASGLRTALGKLGLDGGARIDALGGPAARERRAITSRTNALGFNARTAAAALEREGATGGRPRDEAARTLLWEGARIWIESGLEPARSHRDEDPSPWERFALGLLAVAKPDAKPGEGLKFAREIAARRKDPVLADWVDPDRT